MGSIWCYTTDSNIEKEECFPINFCKNTLSSKGVTSKIIEYDDPSVVFSAKNDLIMNSEEVKCPIKSCKLKIEDCSVDYTSPDLNISPSGNFDISLNSMQAEKGQTIKVCLECSNEALAHNGL